VVADLGAGAALVVAGMATEGIAHIVGVSHVDRGYEKSDHQLHLLGASIQGFRDCLAYHLTRRRSTLTLNENFDSLLALSHLSEM
jgi:hypothetical protein